MVLGVVGPVVDTAGQIGESVPGVGVGVVGGRRVLTLRPGTVLPGGARGPSSTHHHPVNGLVLLGGLHQVSEEVVVREMGLVN